MKTRAVRATPARVARLLELDRALEAELLAKLAEVRKRIAALEKAQS